MKNIKALTLRHPWAWAILHGKDVENRTWARHSHVGHFVAIHGGKYQDNNAYKDEIKESLYWMHMQGILSREALKGLSPWDVLPEGIIAVAKLKKIVQDSPSPWAADRQYHWCLTDVVKLPKAVPCKGSQGLWELPQDVLLQVREQYRSGILIPAAHRLVLPVV